MKADVKRPLSQSTCFTCKKKGRKSTKCKQRRWCDNDKSKKHDTKFCRKNADTAKIVTERKADILKLILKIKLTLTSKLGKTLIQKLWNLKILTYWLTVVPLPI